jgi:hypothetical protein
MLLSGNVADMVDLKRGGHEGEMMSLLLSDGLSESRSELLLLQELFISFGVMVCTPEPGPSIPSHLGEGAAPYIGRGDC